MSDRDMEAVMADKIRVLLERGNWTHGGVREPEPEPAPEPAPEPLPDGTVFTRESDGRQVRVVNGRQNEVVKPRPEQTGAGFTDPAVINATNPHLGPPAATDAASWAQLRAAQQRRGF